MHKGKKHFSKVRLVHEGKEHFPKVRQGQRAQRQGAHPQDA